MDYTGTGNSLNLRHPNTLQLVMDSLRYWVSEMHVDGFSLRPGDDADTRAGLRRHLGGLLCDYSSGSVAPARQAHRRTVGRRHQWLPGRKFSAPLVGVDDRFRETARRCWSEGCDAGELAQRMTGNPDLFQPTAAPSASINYVSSHDGLTLRDLVVRPASIRQPGGAKPPSAQPPATTAPVDVRTVLAAGDEWGRS